MIKKKYPLKKNETYQKIDYVCDYCKFEFIKFSKKSNRGQKVSTQIVCPKCSNGIRTWK